MTKTETETTAPPTNPPKRRGRPPKAQAVTQEPVTEMGGFRVGDRVRVLQVPLYEGFEGEIRSFNAAGRVSLQLDKVGPPCDFSIAKIEPVELISGAIDLPVLQSAAEPVQLSLFDLIGLINAEHQKCEAAYGEMLLHAKQTGDYLTQAKGMVPHGGWLPWVAENCSFGERAARNYMRIAKNWNEISNRQTSADLSIDSALSLLAGEKETEVIDGEIVDTPVTPINYGNQPENPAPAAAANPNSDFHAAYLEEGRQLAAGESPGFAVGDTVKLTAAIYNWRLNGSVGRVLAVGMHELDVQIPNYAMHVIEPFNCWELSSEEPIKFVDGAPERSIRPNSTAIQSTSEAAGLGETEPPKIGTAASIEADWPLPYGRRVRMLECPPEFEYWRTLIGEEGYVVKCSKKSGDWHLMVKIDGEQMPVSLLEDYWLDLGTQNDFSKPTTTTTPTTPTPVPVPPIMARAGSDEFYTPEILWRPALEAWGVNTYCLDPATNDKQSPNVPAIDLFDKSDNGLEREWSSCIGSPVELLWCNPPFSLMMEFAEKLISEICLGNVRHAIFLAKCDCRTKWFEYLTRNSNAVLFIHESIKFIGAENGSFFGVCLFYFGNEEGRFYRAYERLGSVMQLMIPGQFGE